MKKEIKNISFKGGIVENYKQDYFTQQEWYAEHMLTSALYMENYNPNIEYHSLVLRPGLDVLLNADGQQLLGGFANVFANINYSTLTNLPNLTNFLKTLHIQHYARMNYVDSETNYSKLDAIFVSNILPPANLPAYHQYGANENLWSTNICFHAVDPRLTPVVESWQNAYNASSREGYLPLGKFRDMVRNGSRFLFVTEPTNELHGNFSQNTSTTKRLYFPVYTFEQVKDPKKLFLKARRETTYDYLNGLTETDLDDAFWDQVALRRFRIKYPAPIFKDNDAIDTSIRSQVSRKPNVSRFISRWLLDNGWVLSQDQNDNKMKYVKSGETTYNQEDVNEYEQYYGQFIEPSFLGKSFDFDTILSPQITNDDPFNDSADMTKPLIELLVWEQPLTYIVTPRYTASVPDPNTPSDTIAAYIPPNKLPSDLVGQITEVGNVMRNIIKSWDETRRNVLVMYKRMGYTFFGNQNQNTWSCPNMAELYFHKTSGKKNENPGYKNPYLETFLKPNHHILSKSLSGATTWEDTSLTLNNETFRFWSLGSSYRDVQSNVSKTVHHAARFVAHDYIKVELPRSWMKGDKIPFLLTATMNGQEIVLLKETYEVGKDVGLVTQRIKHGKNSDEHEMKSHSIGDYLTVNDLVEDVNDTQAKWDAANYLVKIPRDRKKYDNSIELTKVNGTQENEVGIAPIDSLTLYDDYYMSDSAEDENLKNLYTTDLSGLHNTIQFTVRINKEALAILLAQGTSNIKVYASRPNNDEKLFDKVGSSSLTDAPPIYAKPIITENSDDKIIEGTNYGLLKTFLIEGKSDIIQDYTDVKRSNYRTNAWTLNKGWIYAIPVNEGDRKAGLDDSLVPGGADTFATPQNRVSVLPSFRFSTDDYSSALKEYFNNFTPDFFLWDYPSDTESYIIGDSGQYWEGTGARCITSVKGRTFIGGTFDKDFTEEQGTIRWSSLNNGSHITDLFAEEARLQVGHLPITSLLEYREQLWVFNKENYYRVMLNEIGNVNSWEFVDSKFGQGTYSPKTVCKTPYGVCFASEGGIFLSDGTNPLNLVDNAEQVLAIKSLYQHLMLGNTYQYSQINNPGDIFIEPGKDYNIYAELYYESEKDELILTTPIKRPYGIDFDMRSSSDDYYSMGLSQNEYNGLERMNYKAYYDSETHLSNSHWYKLIYSFANKNWRTETGCNYGGTEPPYMINITHAEHGRMWEDDRVLRSGIPVESPFNLNANSPINTAFDFGIYSYNINANHDIIRNPTLPSMAKLLYIWGQLSTHEIGNGEDDHILNKVILECTPKEDVTDQFIDYNRYTYITQNDPYLGYELRNRTYVNQLARFNEIDLVALNMAAKGGLNPFRSIMTTPTTDTTNYTIDGSETEVGRESLNLIAPMSKFRRTRFRLLSKVIAKIRTLTVSYKVFNRRNY